MTDRLAAYDDNSLDRARLISRGMDSEMADNLIGRANAATARKDAATHALALARAEWEDASVQEAKCARDLRVALMHAGVK